VNHTQEAIQPHIEESIEKTVNSKLEDRLKPLMWYVKGFTAAIGLLAIIGLSAKSVLVTPIMRWAYPPDDIRQDLEKLSSNGRTDIEKLGAELFETFGDRVDSGYSKTMIFRPNVVPVDNYIVFYARPDQSSFATIEPSGEDTAFHFIVTIDQKSVQLDHAIEDGSLTKYLSFDFDNASPGKNLHVLRILPTQPVEADTVVLCVVLVKNKKDKA
jgi:hypothetical protein